MAGALPALEPGHDLVPLARWTDQLGQSHTRNEHRFQGRRVWGSALVEHEGPGAASPTGLRTLPPPGLEILPVSPLALGPWRQPLARVAGPGEPVLFPVYVDLPDQADAMKVDRHLQGLRPATLYSDVPSSTAPGDEAYAMVVDDETGEVLAHYPEQRTQAAKGTGHSLFRGTVSFDTLLAGGHFFMVDLTRGVRDGALGNLIVEADGSDSAGSLFSRATNTWGNGQAEMPGNEPDPVTRETLAVDMAFGLQKTWDYFSRIHGRNGIDGTGGRVIGRARGASSAAEVDNAFWKANKSNTFTVCPSSRDLPYGDLPTLAHELTHGVTEWSAGLIYKGESGGLDEATSDIFGAMVQTWVDNGSGSRIGDRRTDWTVTSQRPAPGGGRTTVLIRSMIKPSTVPPSVDTYAPGIGLLNPHYSSGPMNRAFHFLSAGSSAFAGERNYSPLLPGGMRGLGNDKATAIWYRTLTTYLEPDSGYANARRGALRAARDLFPGRFEEPAAVAKAFCAVGVGGDRAQFPTTGPVSLALTAVPRGTDLVLTVTPGDDVYDIQAVHFFVDNLYVGKDDLSPYTLTLDAARLLRNGGHTFTASVFSTWDGWVGDSQSVPFSLANPVQNLLLDGGFEGAGVQWTGDKGATVALPAAKARTGYRCLEVDGVRSGGRALSLTQRVTIPAGSGYARLRFWRFTQGDAARGGADALQVALGEGSAATALARYASGAEPPAWVLQEFDLAAQAGRTLDLTFTARVAAGSATVFRIDDVQMLAAPVPPIDVTITPSLLTFWAGGSESRTLSTAVTGTANQAVTWSFLGTPGGTLPSATAPAFVQPSLPGTYVLQARSVADPFAAAQATVLVKPVVALLPVAATVEAGTSLDMAVDAAPGTALSEATVLGGPDPGTILPAGPGRLTYMAPATAGTYQVQVDAGDQRAQAQITVIPPVAVTLAPAQAVLAAGTSIQFTAQVQGDPQQAVAWAVAEGAAGGVLSSTGLYAAPAAPGTYHVIATSLLNPGRRSEATVVVKEGLCIDPAAATLLPGATLLFNPSVPGHTSQAVAWKVPAGAGTFQGNLYTAPGTPGSYVLTATSVSGPGFQAQVTVTVKTTDLDRDARTLLDFDDLASLADAYGTPSEDADFDGDGWVGEPDVALFLTRFGGLPPSADVERTE